jgi:hypothetical protein
MTNGNGNKITLPVVVFTVIVSVISLVVGWYQANASMAEKYVPKEQYRCDISRIDGKIDTIIGILLDREKK